MAITTSILPAPRTHVFALLEGPSALAYFVVGTRKIRSFDAQWPKLHTEVHHSVGVGPFQLRDTTEVIENHPPNRLVLEARFRSFGVVTVDFELLEHANGTELLVEEYPVRGLVALPGVSRLVDAIIALRNKEMLRRINRLVELREAQRDMAFPSV